MVNELLNKRTLFTQYVFWFDHMRRCHWIHRVFIAGFTLLIAEPLRPVLFYYFGILLYGREWKPYIPFGTLPLSCSTTVFVQFRWRFTYHVGSLMMRPMHAVTSTSVPCSRVYGRLDENRAGVLVGRAAAHSNRMLHCQDQRHSDLLHLMVAVGVRPLQPLQWQLHDAKQKIAIPMS